MYWDSSIELLDTVIRDQNFGLITDMDGTLSPIVEKPDEAYVTKKNRSLLKELNNFVKLVAIVSGRELNDLMKIVNLPELVYVGSHGMQRWINGSVVVLPEVKQARGNLEKVISILNKQLEDNMFVEDKDITISLHYRRSATPELIEQKYQPIVQDLASTYNLHIENGRKVFEFRPPVNIDKGTILQDLVNENSLNTFIYLGDDTSDARAMKKGIELRKNSQYKFVSIGVESEEMASEVRDNSDLLARGVSDIESLLEYILKIRESL